MATNSCLLLSSVSNSAFGWKYGCVVLEDSVEGLFFAIEAARFRFMMRRQASVPSTVNATIVTGTTTPIMIWYFVSRPAEFLPGEGGVGAPVGDGTLSNEVDVEEDVVTPSAEVAAVSGVP